MSDEVSATAPATGDRARRSRATEAPPTLFGTGLSRSAYVALLILSVALFVFYGGPLWRPSGSHGMRFFVSYGAVVPLVAVALAVSQAFRWPRLATAVGTLWGFKLIITAPLYYALVPGGALDEIGAVPTATSRALPSAEVAPTPPSYEPAEGAFRHGDVKGLVRRADAPAAGAMVHIERPLAGRSLAPARDVELVFLDEGFEAPTLVATTADRILIRNGGSRMHAARVRQGGHTRLNAPVASGGKARVTDLSGELAVECANHPNERATMLIVDHPYATATDAEGKFMLKDVSVGKAVLVATAVVSGTVYRSRERVEVVEGENKQLSLVLEASARKDKEP